jgi:hypothetical protein
MPADWIKEGTTSQVVRIVFGLSPLVDELHRLEISLPSLNLLDHIEPECVLLIILAQSLAIRT